MAYINRNYISFGSLFCHFAAEAILHSDEHCDELQVFFYVLNDGCGPCRNQSVAEFPISVNRFKFEYAKKVKATGRMTLEEFLGMVVSTTFEDNRASGYDMQKAYKPWSGKEDDKIENSDQYDSAMLEWTSKYGAFTRPVIEMSIESGTAVVNDDPVAVFARSEKDASAADPTRIVKRIHVYDKAADPMRQLSQVIRGSDGTFWVGATAKRDKIRGTDWFKKYCEENIAYANLKQKGNVSAPPPASSALDEKIVGSPEQYMNTEDAVKFPGGYKGYLEILSSFAPKIRIGANGTLVTTANLSSKNNTLASSINMQRQASAYKDAAGVLAPANGLEEANGLPLRTYPAQLTLQTLGVPSADIYQQYFIDFQTGTSIDTLYNCTSIKHSFSQGKFMTDWTFMYTGGYGAFGGTQTMINALQKKVDEMVPKPTEPQKK